MTLTSVMTLEGHKDSIRSMTYFPDGKRIISVSYDKTIRQWDLQAGKGIEEVQDVYEGVTYGVVVSRDGRWVMTAGGDEEYKPKELKAYEVETGIMKTFQDSRYISCIDISADGKLLASGSDLDCTVLIRRMDTGELVADPFKTGDDFVGAVRFSPNSKKLAVRSKVGKCLEVWDVQTHKLDARVGKQGDGYATSAPIFWTKKGTILAVFNFDFDNKDSKPATIYEFDASTLETVGDPFQGHTNTIDDLAFSSDGTLLASSSSDNTINFWSIESRQLLASFHVQHETDKLIFSPDTRQLAYSADDKIFICTIPPDILTSIRLAPDAQAIVNAPDNSTLNDLLNSDATRRRANVLRNPATSPMISLPPRPLQPIHTRGPQQPVFLRHLRNLLSFSYHFNAVPPVQNCQPSDPLDIPATSSRIHDHTSIVRTTQGHSHREHPQRTATLPTTLSSFSSPATLRTRIQHLSRWWPSHASHPQPPIVDVPLAQGQLRNAAAGAPNNDEDLIPEEYFDISSQTPNSGQPPAAARIDTGEHVHGRSCFCF